MVKFLNQSGTVQTIYLPTTVADNTRYVIDTDLAITVDDERDVEFVRRLCGGGVGEHASPFIEVPADHPSKDYRRSRMSL